MLHENQQVAVGLKTLWTEDNKSAVMEASVG